MVDIFKMHREVQNKAGVNAIEFFQKAHRLVHIACGTDCGIGKCLFSKGYHIQKSRMAEGFSAKKDKSEG